MKIKQIPMSSLPEQIRGVIELDIRMMHPEITSDLTVMEPIYSADNLAMVVAVYWQDETRDQYFFALCVFYNYRGRWTIDHMLKANAELAKLACQSIQHAELDEHGLFLSYQDNEFEAKLVSIDRSFAFVCTKLDGIWQQDHNRSTHYDLQFS